MSGYLDLTFPNRCIGSISFFLTKSFARSKCARLLSWLKIKTILCIKRLHHSLVVNERNNIFASEIKCVILSNRGRRKNCIADDRIHFYHLTAFLCLLLNLLFLFILIIFIVHCFTILVVVNNKLHLPGKIYYI